MITYPIEAKKVVIPEGLGNNLSYDELYQMAYNAGYTDGFEKGVEDCQNNA